jgi:Flp pilus assembly protein TadB
MVPDRKPTVEEIIKKHSAKIEQNVRSSEIEPPSYSQTYSAFKQEMAPELSRYEKLCKTLGSIVKLKVSSKDQDKIRKSLEIAHLDLEPWQPITLSIVAFIGVFILGLLISTAIALFQGGIESFPFFFLVLTMFFGLFLFYFLNGYPARLANKWRLKASSQMMPAILYIVVYMRHTPNLEKAISFASQHLQYPLALDFKKIFYDVQVGKFSTIKESLDNYLNNWKDYSIEFIEAFHLIESSLFEPDDAKRIITLEKSLQVVLDGVYDKMLKFTHEVRSPLTNVYMLGVVLPTLGLALLPLASAMVGDFIKWYHVFILFNLIIPFFVFYLTDKVMFLRPGGYGETDLLERNPLYPNYKNNKHYAKAFLICLPFFIIGLLPLIFQFTPIPSLFGLKQDYTFSELGLGIFGNEYFFGIVNQGGITKGPFGIGALIMGVFFTLGTALFFSIAFKNKTQDLIKERNKTKQLEIEFNSSLFQLGNRIGNGIPPELAFSKVAESTRGLKTEDFFRRVNYNIMQMGMSVEQAVFDPKRGVLVYYPSELIATSMKILVESAKKGLTIAALSLISLSEYVKNMNKITDRLKDLLAEIISDMKSNMTFLAPLLSGIVIGLAAMISSILIKLKTAQGAAGGETEAIAGFGSLNTITGLFDYTIMIPPYFLQLIVGIYIIEVIFILTNTLVVVESGADKLEQTNKTGINLKRGVGLYVVTALLAIISLFLLTATVLGNLT